MRNLYHSWYKCYSGQTLNWMSTDSEELYKYNLIKNVDLLEKYGWKDTIIEYRFNSEGFRSNEFTGDEKLLTFGCSWTMGVGINYEQTWSYLLAQDLKLPLANFGIAGGSPDTAFRMFRGYIDKFQPKIVIFMQPPGARFEVIRFNNVDIFQLPIDLERVGSYGEMYIENDYNILFNNLKNMYAMRYICQEKGIKFLYYDNFYQQGEISILNPTSDEDDRARDLQHQGIKYNKSIANYLLQYLD